MLSRVAMLAPVFLALQTAGVYWIAGGERVPAAPDFARFPAMLANWQKTHEYPIDADVAGQLRADRTLNWSYFGETAGWQANLFVAWFRSQRGGAQPHSPQVCLPANGWIPVVADRIALAPSLPVNRYIVSLGQQHAVVLYWYQTPRRVIASEWAAKFWVVADALKDHRTDTALVRVVVWNNGKSDQETTAAALDFARGAYPALRGILPQGWYARSRQEVNERSMTVSGSLCTTDDGENWRTVPTEACSNLAVRQNACVTLYSVGSNPNGRMDWSEAWVA